jgi:hypothetical protein
MTPYEGGNGLHSREMFGCQGNWIPNMQRVVRWGGGHGTFGFPISELSPSFYIRSYDTCVKAK